MTFTYVDWIIVGLAVLLGLIGYFRGFLISVVSLCNWIVKIIISFFLCKPLATLISKITPWDEYLANSFTKDFSKMGAVFQENLAGLNAEQLSSKVGQALSDNNIPSFLRGLFKEIFKITPEAIQGHDSINLAQIMGGTVGSLLMIAICFVVIFILLYIVIAIVKAVSKNLLSKNKGLKTVDRILGILVGFVQGFLILTVIFGIFYIFRNSEIFSDINTVINKSCIGKPVSDFIYGIIEKYINVKAILQNIISKL